MGDDGSGLARRALLDIVPCSKRLGILSGVVSCLRPFHGDGDGDGDGSVGLVKLKFFGLSIVLVCADGVVTVTDRADGWRLDLTLERRGDWSRWTAPKSTGDGTPITGNGDGASWPAGKKEISSGR